MATKRKLLSVSFLGLLLISTGKLIVAESVPRDPVLAVLVYNFSEVTPEVLDRAEKETQRIFVQQKIYIIWTGCPIQRVSPAKAACYQEPAPGQIRLRVLKRSSNHRFQDSIFGFAIAPLFASVYYDSAVRLTMISINRDFDLSIILGCLIAHEIGHLLLGENRHSASGIMKAHWELRQVQLAMMGSLVFLPEEKTLLYVNAREREDQARAAVEGFGTQ